MTLVAELPAARGLTTGAAPSSEHSSEHSSEPLGESQCASLAVCFEPVSPLRQQSVREPSTIPLANMAEKEKEVRCSWDGDISTFQDYVRRVRLAYERTRRRRRRHLGPELVSQLTGRAWTITQEIDHQKLVRDDGAKYLVEYLEERLARVPVPDAGARAEELLVRLRRPLGMSMSTWCATVRGSYRRLQRALKRARPLSEVPSPTSPGTGTGATEASPSRSLAGFFTFQKCKTSFA